MLIASTTAWADYDVDPYVELLLMAGVTTTDSENATLETFSFQELEQTNQSDWNFFTGQVGVSYVYPLADFSTGVVDWFPSIMPQINVYFIDSGEIVGNMYEQPTNVNNLDYTMDYDNIRAMFDLGITVLAIDRFSIYALAGVGMSWNSIDFKANPTPEGMDNDVDPFELYGQHSSSMAYEFGGGVSYALLDSVAISVEYLYAGILDVKIDQDNNDYTADVASTEFDINTQTILAGLRLKFP
jgi:opacity protein-like surface antigen